MVKQSEKSDLVFMVDATGSMARQIANVKEQIVKITKKVKATNQSLKLRVAAVFYRDALDGDGGNTTLVEVLADQTPAPEQVVEQAHRYERVTKLFDSALTARERDVLGMTFGLGGRAPLSKTKIAELLRVSRERVRQIEVRALGKLRSHVREPRAA